MAVRSRRPHRHRAGATQERGVELLQNLDRDRCEELEGRLVTPITISAVFPSGFTHPHLVAGGPVNPRAASLIAWPMQVRSHQDAEHHLPLLWAIATTELHDRIYQSSWRIIPA